LWPNAFDTQCAQHALDTLDTFGLDAQRTHGFARRGRASTRATAAAAAGPAGGDRPWGGSGSKALLLELRVAAQARNGLLSEVWPRVFVQADPRAGRVGRRQIRDQRDDRVWRARLDLPRARHGLEPLGDPEGPPQFEGPENARGRGAGA